MTNCENIPNHFYILLLCTSDEAKNAIHVLSFSLFFAYRSQTCIEFSGSLFSILYTVPHYYSLDLEFSQ